MKTAKFTCFVTADSDTSPEALKVSIPHAHRGVQFKEQERGPIQKLFSHVPIPSDIKEGTWIFEQMINREYGFFLVPEENLTKEYKEFDARGILGCGEGSERFKR